MRTDQLNKLVRHFTMAFSEVTLALLILAAALFALPAAAEEVKVVTTYTTIVGHPTGEQLRRSFEEYDGVVLVLSNGQRITVLRTVAEMLRLSPGTIVLPPPTLAGR